MTGAGASSQACRARPQRDSEIMKWHAGSVVPLLVLAARPAGAASPCTGQVTSGGVPIPGVAIPGVH